MSKSLSPPERNVETIRRKNLEDNQHFLEKLRITNIRNDFVHSARSILRKKESNQIKKKLTLSQQKIERTTRYSEKVKSGLISPYVPEWQRHIEQKKKEAEKKLLEKERKKQEMLLKKEQKKLEIERKRQEILLKKERKREEYARKREEVFFEKELRKIERELIAEGIIKIRRARRRPRKPSKWTLFYRNHPYPYQRVFEPRHTKVDERIRQNLS